MAVLNLRYGLIACIPDDVTAAWGARLIWPNDLVWDRQSFAGDEDGFDGLTEWLNGGVLKHALEVAAKMARSGELTPSETRTVPLYEGLDGTVMADPRGSHGYLYVAAWKLPTTSPI